MGNSAVKPGEIAAIGLSGTMNGIIPVNGAGEALYPNITHQDTRAIPQLAAIEREITREEYYRRTGNRIDVHSSLLKAAWLRDELPEIYRETRFFLNTKDYLHGCLTGFTPIRPLTLRTTFSCGLPLSFRKFGIMFLHIYYRRILVS